MHYYEAASYQMRKIRVRSSYGFHFPQSFQISLTCVIYAYVYVYLVHNVHGVLFLRYRVDAYFKFILPIRWRYTCSPTRFMATANQFFQLFDGPVKSTIYTHMWYSILARPSGLKCFTRKNAQYFHQKQNNTTPRANKQTVSFVPA